MNIEQERKAFEEKFPIPENCIWCGDGYAPTEFHAWEAKRCAQMFVGWLARARLQHLGKRLDANRMRWQKEYTVSVGHDD